ncbi:MAG: SpoIID/LytB domain-containing protein [Lachnospiraceae bacterium]|nr:SpoIID/LytB domain-containing protein [Lachnospiraceae bacterium]
MKKIKWWKGILLLLAAVLAVTVALWRQTSPDTEEEDTVYMTQAYAMKAAACLLADTAVLAEDKTLPEVSSGEAWCDPYARYLYARGYWESAVDEDTAQDLMWELLTWEQVRHLTEVLTQEERLPEAGFLSGNQLLPGKAASGDWDDRRVSEEEWWKYFADLAEALGCEDYQVVELTVSGTDETVDIAAGRAATSEGKIRYSGFSMKEYIDKKVRVRLLGSDLLAILNVTGTAVTYENVWLQGSTADYLSVFMEGFSRDFAVSGLEGDYRDVLADITLDNGTLTKIAVKRDRIAGKVLAVTDDYIEIQGYGKVPLSQSARVYQLYDGIKLKKLANIVVGYSVHEFIVADGEICGALALENIEVETIRVLISNNGFNGSDHDRVSLISDGTMRITIGDQTSEWPGGTEFAVTPSSDAFDSGRIIIEADDEIQITSLERSYGVPYYKGSIELALSDDGIWVVNEVQLEDYLCRVVPSEMPAGHGLEALKAQAVCARSYAYNQIRANACRSKGAHVDDTTTYQVYNNSNTKELCTQAVQETAGRVLTYDGDVITAYYSSTTCGSSTDTTIWGSSPAEYPYLMGRMLSLAEEQPDLTDEETFRAFIKDTEYETFDTDFAWYRWNLYADLTALSDAINTSLSKLGEHGSQYILVQQEDGTFRQEKIRSLGAVTRMEVTARGAGGIVSELLVEGTEATIRILRQGNVRSYLGNRDHVITKKDGSTVTNMGTIPSAFICLEEVYEGDNLTGYQIYGGGYGHGVGMSQNAAKTMAAQGMGCEEILQFFYPGTELTSIYEG